MISGIAFWLLIAACVLAHGLFYLNAVLNVLYMRRHRPPGAASGGPSVSILIPARNEAANLPRLLSSLRNQDYAGFEVLVYDDESTDGTGEILGRESDPRITGIKGTGLPQGWVGKVHACYQLSRRTTGDVYLFLDADTELLDPGALGRLVSAFKSRPEGSVVTGIPRLGGGGHLLVSMVGNMILGALPWWAVLRTPFRSKTGLNGQCWMIDAETYHRLEPHEHLRGEVLEDIRIGRYLGQNGVAPILHDLHRELAVYMYADTAEAWMGFRRNAAEMLGRRAPVAWTRLAAFMLFFLVAPAVAPVFLISIYGLKLITDRATGISPWITLVTPVSYVMAAVLAADSILSRSRRLLEWKGRRLGS